MRRRWTVTLTGPLGWQAATTGVDRGPAQSGSRLHSQVRIGRTGYGGLEGSLPRFQFLCVKRGLASGQDANTEVKAGQTVRGGAHGLDGSRRLRVGQAVCSLWIATGPLACQNRASGHNNRSSSAWAAASSAALGWLTPAAPGPSPGRVRWCRGGEASSWPPAACA